MVERASLGSSRREQARDSTDERFKSLVLECKSFAIAVNTRNFEETSISRFPISLESKSHYGQFVQHFVRRGQFQRRGYHLSLLAEVQCVLEESQPGSGLPVGAVLHRHVRDLCTLPDTNVSPAPLDGNI
jgi:hypothetical protein